MSKIISKRKREQLERELAHDREAKEVEVREAEDLEWILEQTLRDVVVDNIDINYIDFGDDHEDHQ